MIEPQLKTVFQKGFATTSRVLLKTKFAGVWLDRESAYGGDRPWPTMPRLFLFATHASWWDPVVAGYLAIDLMKRRTLAPMDARQFRARKSLRYVGVFGVEPGDGPAVEGLLRRELSEHPNTCVWVTPQGVFHPNEVVQPEFKSGLSRWSNEAGCARVPVVVHYHLSQESSPEIFVRFGAPVPPSLKSTSEDASLLRETLTVETKTLLEKVWRGHAGARFDHSAFMRLL